MDVRLLQLRLLKLAHALPPTYSTGVYKIAVLPFIAVRSPPSDSLASAPPMDIEWTCIAPSEHHRHSVLDCSVHRALYWEGLHFVYPLGLQRLCTHEPVNPQPLIGLLPPFRTDQKNRLLFLNHLLPSEDLRIGSSRDRMVVTTGDEVYWPNFIASSPMIQHALFATDGATFTDCIISCSAATSRNSSSLGSTCVWQTIEIRPRRARALCRTPATSSLQHRIMRSIKSLRATKGPMSRR